MNEKKKKTKKLSHTASDKSTILGEFFILDQ